MADVPGDSGHGLGPGLHDGVLNNVGWAGHVSRQVLLSPAGHAARLGQQTPWNKAVVWSHLPENDVLRQDMVAEIDTERTGWQPHSERLSEAFRVPVHVPGLSVSGNYLYGLGYLCQNAMKTWSHELFKTLKQMKCFTIVPSIYEQTLPAGRVR